MIIFNIFLITILITGILYELNHNHNTILIINYSIMIGICIGNIIYR